ncbi:MAG TPA: HEAT repeat domain-containing protein, partial [Candidatus Ozemobacteraceae bacterium]
MNETAIGKIRTMQEQAASRLAPLLAADLPLPIRAHAAVVIAKSHAPGSARQVLDFFDAFPDLEESIRAAGEVGGEEALAKLIERVHTKRAQNRDVIAEVLGNFRTPSSTECLKELLGDEDRHVRYQAASSLFVHGGREAALALCRYISDQDEWISMTILRFLCRMKEHESIPFLAEQFAKDGDLRRKAQMVSFLSMFRSVTLVNIFDEGLKGKDARLKANSIEAIGELELPHREIQARIMPFLHDPNNRIRANTILALARAQAEHMRPEIVQMVESNDVQLRRSAAYILGQISPAGNEELAARLVVDPSDDVRRRMILSLRKFPAEFVRSQIERAITDPNKWIRKFAIEMAAGIPDFPKQPILRQFKLETAYPNIVACIEFFAKHPDDEGIRLMRQRVKDTRHQVVSALIRAVGAIYGLKGLQALAPQINSRDPKIFTTYVTSHFGMGGVELFDSVLEKAALVKKPPTNEMFLGALEGCLELLTLGEKMPAQLQDELGRAPVMPIIEEAPVVAAEPPLAADGQQIPSASVPSQEEGASEPVLGQDDLESAAPRKPKSRLPASFAAGVKQYNLGKYKKARSLFREALVDHPDLAKAHYYLGMMAFEEREFDAARESLSLYLESEPDNRKAIHSLARIYKHQRDWPNVARMYEKLTAGLEGPLDKVGIRMMRELGSSYIFMKRYQEARTVLETVFKADPTDLETNFHLAMSCFHLQNYMRAETLLMDIMRQTEPGDKLRGMAESLIDKIRDQLSAPAAPEPA